MHGEDRHLSAPLVSGPPRVVELLEDLIHVDGNWAKWGAAHHWRSAGGEILEAWLRCAVLEIDVGGHKEADRRERVAATRQAVGAWASILFDWIEVQGVLVWSEHANDWRWFGGLAIDTGLSPLNWYQGPPARPFTYVATWSGFAYTAFVTDVNGHRNSHQ